MRPDRADLRNLCRHRRTLQPSPAIGRRARPRCRFAPSLSLPSRSASCAAFQASSYSSLRSVQAPLHAQHSYSEPGNTYDPRSPRRARCSATRSASGSRRTTLLMRYIERVAAAHARACKVDTVARTFEGREMLRHRRHERGEHGAPRRTPGATRSASPTRAAPPPASVEAAVTRACRRSCGSAHSVHGGEASGVEAGLALLYQLAAGTRRRDAPGARQHRRADRPQREPRRPRAPRAGRRAHVRARMSVPDRAGRAEQQRASGRARAPATTTSTSTATGSSSRIPRRGGACATSSRGGRTSRSTCTRWGRAHLLLRAADGAGQQERPGAPAASGWTSSPPRTAPPSTRTAGRTSAARATTSSIPATARSWPMLTGADRHDLRVGVSGGGAVRRTDGTVLTLREAARDHYTAAWTTVRTSARRRAERVRDYAQSRQRRDHACTPRRPMRAVVFERDAAGARRLAGRASCARNGIDVQRLTARRRPARRDGVRRATRARHARARARARTSSTSRSRRGASPRAARARRRARLGVHPRGAGAAPHRAARALLRRDRVVAAVRVSRARVDVAHAARAGSQPCGDLAARARAARRARAVRLRVRARERGVDAAARRRCSPTRVRVWYAPRRVPARRRALPARRLRRARRRRTTRPCTTRVARRRAARGRRGRRASHRPAWTRAPTWAATRVVPVRAPRVALLGGAPVSGQLVRLRLVRARPAPRLPDHAGRRGVRRPAARSTTSTCCRPVDAGRRRSTAR